MGPYLFDEFLASGLEESISPFLTRSSRKWSKNLSLKIAITSACLLALSFVLSFYNTTLSYFFLSFVYFFSGTPALLNTFEDFKNLEINIDVLMTLAAFLSLAIGSGLEGGLLLVLFELSGAMESMVTHKAKGTLNQLHQLSPRMAFVFDEDGAVIEKTVRDIQVGEKILVKAGEIIPLDGEVVEGRSSLNLVHLTGESLPVSKKMGDEVPAGARNLDAGLTIRVTRMSADSTLSRIIQLITQAQEAKPQLQRFLDRFGKPYSMTIILLTILFAISFPFLFSMSFFGWEGSIYRALTFMIAASPCALIIGAPTAYLSAISSCARKGVLLKGGITLDALASCKTVGFDKTGTLTTGELSLSSIETLQGNADPDFALQAAAALEHHVVHPISSAILKSHQEKKLPFLSLEDFQSHPGFGLEGTIAYDGKKMNARIGIAEFILEKIGPKEKEDLEMKLKALERKGWVLAILLLDSSIFLFRFSDTLRPGAKEMLDELGSLELEPVMMTGDHQENAEEIARLVDLKQIHADLRPEDKLQLISELSKKAPMAMVGDGINDAPALARATVGISMGKVGSATAVDASDVVLLNDELPHLSWLFKKSRSAIRIVKENLTLALCVIIFATTPALLGFIPLWLAVVLHEGGTVIVGLNSLRLLKS